MKRDNGMSRLSKKAKLEWDFLKSILPADEHTTICADVVPADARKASAPK